jgi:hypothetical protein
LDESVPSASPLNPTSSTTSSFTTTASAAAAAAAKSRQPAFTPPTQVSALRGKRVVKVSAGHKFTCCVTDMGDLYTWHDDKKSKPTRVGSMKRVSNVAVAEGHTIALMICARPTLPPLIDGGDVSSFNHEQDIQQTDVGNLSVLVEEEEEEEDTGSEEEEDDDDEDDDDEDIMNVSFHADLDPDPMAIVTNHLNDDDDLNGGGINPSQQEQNVATTSKVPTLKRLCEIALAKAVNTSTLVDTLAYSEALDARALTRYCVSFMRMNLDAVLLSITHNPIDIEVLRYQTSAGLIGVVPEDLDNMFAFVDAEDEVAAELRDSKIEIGRAHV